MDDKIVDTQTSNGMWMFLFHSATAHITKGW